MATHTHGYAKLTFEEQKIYDHLLHWVNHESPEDLIARFEHLFIDSTLYNDPEIAQALARVTSQPNAKEEFRYILNRCCHILINRWQSRPQSQSAIPKLIDLFDNVSPSMPGGLHRAQSAKRLRYLVANFKETEQFTTLKRLAQVLEDEGDPADTKPLSALIPRYPYLYTGCLLNEDSAQEQQRTVQHVQAERQRQFELDLSRCVTNMVRRSQMPSHLQSSAASSRVVRPVKNPTLLPEKELGQAVKHYIGRVDQQKTYRDMAHSFSLEAARSRSYGEFKDAFYEYITDTIHTDYGARHFNQQLQEHLKRVLPNSHGKALNDFLIVRTCTQILNFLLVGCSNQPRHLVFIDLINNLGAILTTGILLKIVLFCRKVKPYLERRLSVLFNHYESHERQSVEWLVNMLEHVNIALSLHFGKIDLSFIR